MSKLVNELMKHLEPNKMNEQKKEKEEKRGGTRQAIQKKNCNKTENNPHPSFKSLLINDVVNKSYLPKTLPLNIYQTECGKFHFSFSNNQISKRKKII